MRPNIALLSLLLVGCGASELAAPATAPPPTAAVEASDAKRDIATPDPSSGAHNAKTAPADGKTAEKADAPDALVMYTGDVMMDVDGAKIGETIDHIVDLAEAVGGHLGARKDQGVMVRVPSARFRETLGKVGALGDVEHESVTAEDVSEEYHDAEVRLANLKATRQRLQDFLAKTGNLNDMLTLERELERVTMDIDRIEGRMRFLREHVAFSTLTVSLVARTKSTPAVAGTGSHVTPASPRVMQLHAEWLDSMGVPNLLGST